MRILDMFRRKKIYLIPYVYNPGDEQVYGLFLIGRSKKDVFRKIQDVATKYNIELYILTEAVDPVDYTTREYEEGEIIRFDYNNKADNDFCKHFLTGPDIDSVEPYFIFTYLEEYIGSCGFKTTGLDCLYESYQQYFAKKNLFKEAAQCRDALIKLREDATVTGDVG